jgi:hypothetical protein
MSLIVAPLEDTVDDKESKKRRKGSVRYTPQDAQIPEVLMPKFDDTLTHAKWCDKQSYTAVVIKSAITYRVAVNWTKQSLWIYGGPPSFKQRNWSFNTWGGVDKAWEAAFSALPDAVDIE